MNTKYIAIGLFALIQICGALEIFTENGDECYLPFTYQGVEYSTCTAAASPGAPWCYTDDENAAWGVCVPSDIIIGTEGGSANGADCQFPFVYNNVYNYECTTEGDTRPWCYSAPRPTDNGQMVKDWGYCKTPSAPVVVNDQTDESENLVQHQVQVVEEEEEEVFTDEVSEVVKTGVATGPNDDDRSSVSCPAGFRVIDCACDNFENCDSNLVVGQGKTCMVIHTNRKPVVRPIATCEKIDDNQYEVKTTKTYERQPSVKCPDGLNVVSCGVIYPWASDWRENVRAMKFEDGTCKVSAICDRGKGCKIQAICMDKETENQDTAIIESVEEGEFTDRDNDKDRSSVDCPAGTRVVECRCDNPANCNRNIVLAGGMKCQVSQTPRLPVVKPIATCRTILHRYEFVYSSAEHEQQPSVKCPDGLNIVSCGVFYPWASDWKENVIAMKFEDGTCKVSALCDQGEGCRIQAICMDIAIPSQGTEIIESVEEGEFTDDDNDKASSSVDCPAGTRVVECRCDNPANCNRNIVLAGGMKCQVSQTVRLPVVKPIATCRTILHRYEFVYSAANSKTPTVTCPDGMQVTTCGLIYPWQNDWNPIIIAVKDPADPTTCKVTPLDSTKTWATCNRGPGCKVQAICEG